MSETGSLQNKTGSEATGATQNSSKNQFPDAATFASAFGQAVWLMTVSKEHRDLPISEIEKRVSPAILLKQFRIYNKGTQPIAFLSWAAVSDDVKERFESGDRSLAPHEWRCGENVVIVECVSPFAKSSEITHQFLSSSKSKLSSRNT